MSVLHQVLFGLSAESWAIHIPLVFLLCLPLHNIKEISHFPWPTPVPMFLDVQVNDLLGCVQKPAHWDDNFVYKERLHVRVCLLCLQIMIVIPCYLCMCSCMIVWQLMTCICRELHLQRNALTSIPVDTFKNSPNLKLVSPPAVCVLAGCILAYIYECTTSGCFMVISVRACGHCKKFQKKCQKTAGCWESAIQCPRPLIASKPGSSPPEPV